VIVSAASVDRSKDRLEIMDSTIPVDGS